MENRITIKNAVIKIDKSIIQQIQKSVNEHGVFCLGRFIIVFLYFLKRFFREYIPLKYLYFISSNGEIVRNIKDNKMVLDLNDLGISRELALYKIHEKNSTKQLEKILRPGMNIVEIGANIGYYALIEAKLIRGQGYIYAFEPSPYNLNLLKRNTDLNNYHNVEIYPKAVGAMKGREKFFIASRSNLSGFIKREDMSDMYGEKGKDSIDVEIVKLDDFLKDKKVDFIRMDIEGYEKEALKGLETTLNSENVPKYLFIEIHSVLLHKKNSSAEEIIRYLEESGYSVIKGFYRGCSEIAVNNTSELLNHSYLEKGYWETFFQYKNK